MARIELRHATIRIKDGFSGTALINDMSSLSGATDVDIDTVEVNGVLGTDVVAVGARFTTPDEGDKVFTVTGRTPSDGSGPTTNIQFSPAFSAMTTPDDGDVLNFLPQQIEVTIGDGNLTYTENRELEYELDRGTLDSVRQGDDQPMEVTLDMVYEFVTTGTSETITPVDALKRKGGAVEWVSSSADPCEPYAVDIEVQHEPSCGGSNTEDEITLFPDFRWDSLEFDLREATISATGRCNAVEPVVTRE
jgi:hypothetical protein